MAKKPTYTETLASVDTHILYMREHLERIDEHLEKLNNSVANQAERITRNTTRINLFFKISGGLATLAVIVLPILWAVGVFGR